MKTKFISLIIIILILITNVNAIELTTNTVELKESNNYWELVNLIDEYTANREKARADAQDARKAGATEDSVVILNAKSQWNFYNSIIKYYQAQLDKVNEELDQVEYKNATLIWEYMKYLGWNDYVCAGILGNMMAEVGGGTLDLPYNTKGNGYYGLCQWNKAYAPTVWDKDLRGQMDFLRQDIVLQLDTYGFCYSYEFNFEKFLQLENEQQAAMAFATCYERCAVNHRYVRQQYATIAYNYFVQ